MRTRLPVFIQIAEALCDRILSGEYETNQRMPSIRDMAVEMNVNPNTAMRAFERLQNHGILSNKKGVGCFVNPDARALIGKMRHADFAELVLPTLFREMELLGIGVDDLIEAYNNYMSNHQAKES